MPKRKSRSLLTFTQVRGWLDYDPASGLFRWRKRSAHRIYVGDIAGTKNLLGYIQIRIEGQLLLAHRLAWLWMTGQWPTMDIDHKDRNPSNNKWSNLRLASHQQNHSNRSKQANNTSGFKGVYWRCDKKKWTAEIIAGGVKHRLGYFAEAEMAHRAYCVAADRLCGQFACSS